MNFDLLEAIINKVPPPKQPLFGGGTRTWESIQEQYDHRLPDEMESFFRVYGSGEFEGNSYINLYNPFDPCYEPWIAFNRQNYVELQENTPSFYPYPGFPDRKALFPIGHGSGIFSFWLLPQLAGAETVLVFNDQSHGLVEYPEKSVFDFFWRFLSNNILENPYFTEPIQFVPRKLTPFV